MYTYGCPRVGEKNFAAYFNTLLTGANYRAVYRNDPVPTLPFNGVLNFVHAGTEIHFYDCNRKSFLPYPPFVDDTPMTILGTWDDHHGYFCLTDADVQEEEV